MGAVLGLFAAGIPDANGVTTTTTTITGEEAFEREAGCAAASAE